MTPAFDDTHKSSSVCQAFPKSSPDQGLNVRRKERPGEGVFGGWGPQIEKCNVFEVVEV